MILWFRMWRNLSLKIVIVAFADNITKITFKYKNIYTAYPRATPQT